MARPRAAGLAPAAPAGGVRAEPVMGTIVSIDVRTPLEPARLERAFTAATDALHDADATFSTFRADSWVTRIARGDATLEQAPERVREVYALAQRCRVRTGGAFDPAWRADGTLDPTGLVKGWAADRAASALTAAGAPDHCVNAAGDLRIRGVRGAGSAWRVGVANPFDPTRLVAVIEGRDLAVATSGLAYQAEHIVDPRTARPAVAVASVTVVGPDLALADAYATAGLAAGDDAEALLADLARDGWAWLLVTAGGTIQCSRGFPGRVAAA